MHRSRMCGLRGSRSCRRSPSRATMASRPTRSRCTVVSPPSLNGACCPTFHCSGRLRRPLSANVEPMHKSLTPQSNVLLMSVWAVTLLGASAIAWPATIWLAGMNFALGAIAGCLQAIALRHSAEAFRASQTAMQVREAMMSTSSGKLSIALLWGAAAVAIVWSLTGKSDNPVAVWLSGYASFALARELFSFSAIRRLAQVA